MTKLVQRHQVLALYKRVLKSHRLLPHDMKHLGDVYVKVEFRQHKDAKPQFVRQFIQEWTKYCENIEANDPKRLSVETLENELSADQQMQLYELMKETTKPAPQFQIEDNDNPVFKK